MKSERAQPGTTTPHNGWTQEQIDGECGDDLEHDDDEIEEHECGLMRDGQCLLAGTEWCDWDCGRLG